MNLPAPPTGLYPEDYDRIEAAVMETVRGRWFLLEYARRQRATETERLVLAVDRLERYVAARVDNDQGSRQETREVETREVETRDAEPVGDWSLPRRLAERAREFAQTLRASGLDEKFCAQADALAEQFGAYAAAATNEGAASPAASENVTIVETSEAPTDVATSFAYDEAEWSEDVAAEAHAQDTAEPQHGQDAAESQDEAFGADPIVLDSRLLASRPVDPRLTALSRLDHLPLREKLRLFG